MYAFLPSDGGGWQEPNRVRYGRLVKYIVKVQPLKCLKTNWRNNLQQATVEKQCSSLCRLRLLKCDWIPSIQLKGRWSKHRAQDGSCETGAAPRRRMRWCINNGDGNIVYYIRIQGHAFISEKKQTNWEYHFMDACMISWHVPSAPDIVSHWVSVPDLSKLIRCERSNVAVFE